MPIAPEHAFEKISMKLLILLPLRTIYNRTFQCVTPCTYKNLGRNLRSDHVFCKKGNNSQKNKNKIKKSLKKK